jgi:hypothetical protein
MRDLLGSGGWGEKAVFSGFAQSIDEFNDQFLGSEQRAEKGEQE